MALNDDLFVKLVDLGINDFVLNCFDCPLLNCVLLDV